MKPQILVTGATGTTGHLVIENLIKKGIKPRAMVRQIDERSKQLEALGAQIVQGNFHDLSSLRKAMTGIERVYFCYPFKDGLPKGAGYFAKAARENEIKFTVAMSQMNVHEGSSSPATQNHLIAEDILDWAEIGAVHIRPGLFAWNYLNMAGTTVKAEKKFYFPNPDAKYTIIHPQDISDVVAELLTIDNFKPHIRKKYLLSGPKIYSNVELADEIGKVVDDEIEYVPLPVEHWIAAIQEDPYINDFLSTHLKEFSKDIADGKFNQTTDTVEKITGHKPRSFKTYVEENINSFK